MYKMDVYLRVRRAVMMEGMNIREAVRTFGLHRDTVRKMLAYSVPPGYRRQTLPRRHQRYFRRAIAPRPLDCGLGPLPWAGVYCHWRSHEVQHSHRHRRSRIGDARRVNRPGH